MIGCIKAIARALARKERVGKAVPGLARRVGAESSGEERTLDAAAQVERAKALMVLPPLRQCPPPLAWCGSVTVMVLVSSVSCRAAREWLQPRSAIL